MFPREAWCSQSDVQRDVADVSCNLQIAGNVYLLHPDQVSIWLGCFKLIVSSFYVCITGVEAPVCADPQPGEIKLGRIKFQVL